MSRITRGALVLAVGLLAAAGTFQALRAERGPQPTPAAKTAEFFPVAAWYGGGKARAPMLERDARAKKETWRKDVRQIKALGFNTVRAWIDWASGQPAEGTYDFETLEVLLELAQEEGLKLDGVLHRVTVVFHQHCGLLTEFINQ